MASSGHQEAGRTRWRRTCSEPQPQRMGQPHGGGRWRGLWCCLLLLLSDCCWGQTRNVTFSQCVSDFSSSVLRSLEVDAAYLDGLTEDLVEQALLPCVEEAAAADEYVRFLFPLSPIDAPFNASFEPFRQRFNNLSSTALNVVFDVVAGFQGVTDGVASEFEHKGNTSSVHAGFLNFNKYAFDLAVTGAAQDLSKLLTHSTSIAWTDVLPAVRDVIAYHDGKVWAVPLESRLNFLIYRRDVLQQYGLSPPNTWDELLAAVKKVNGTDMDGDGVPDWGACMTMIGLNPGASMCVGAMSIFTYILATFTQSRGLSHGACVDPDTLQVLFTSAAGQKTIELLSALKPYTHPRSFKSCINEDPAFVAGQCAFGVAARTASFKASDVKKGSKLKGKAGIVPLPGSTTILDRETGTMKACTRDTCPLAEEYTQPDGTQLYVNRVAKLDAGMMLGVNAAAPPTMQRAAFQFISYISNSQDSTALWETLPMTVMDETLQLHHNCLRSLLQKFKGYESATEGDSFILAFHNAESALSYALEVQKQLLLLPWPSALLKEPLCESVYATLNARDPTESYHKSQQAKVLLKKQSTFSKFMKYKVEPGPHHSDDMSVTESESRRSAQEVDTEYAKNAFNHHEVLDPQLGQRFLSQCRESWITCDPDSMPPDAAVMFRGVRVRMGLHSGLPEGSVVVNHADDHRTHYTGAALACTKLVADCGQGGVISLSHATYKQLPMESMWAKALVMHNGLHQLEEGKEPMHIYQALPVGLTGRLGFMNPVRSASCLESGAFDAPVGNVIVCYMKILGLDTLQKWNQQVAKHSEGIFQKVATSQLHAFKGYLFSNQGGTFSAAFCAGYDAISWAVQTLQACLEADWPDELLESDLGQVLSILKRGPDGTYRNHTVMRGLRLKAGIHVGPVSLSIQALTGRISYKGHMLQQASQITAKATHQQVLCSRMVWDAACQEAGSDCLLDALSVVLVDSLKLKKVPEPVQLLQVSLVAD